MIPQKHVHFIGIAGKGMAPIANMMKNMGWKVTGSDINVFDPMLSFLNDNHIEWYEGFKPEMIAPADLVIIGGSILMKDMNNPEFLEAKRLNKQLEGYEYLLRTFVVRETSVVIAGTYGKTTTSALMVWIAQKLSLMPSYMTAGQPVDFSEGVQSNPGSISIFEGDEYPSTWGFNMEPRFMFYRPTHTLITASQWDHVNVYPTIDSYVDSFKKLVDETERNNGEILLCASGENNEILQKYAKRPTHTYVLDGTSRYISDVEYIGTITETNEDSYVFQVTRRGELLGSFSTVLLGRHNVENCVGAIAMCDLLGFDMKGVRDAIATFHGVKVHLEKLGSTKNGALVYNDLAHSAVKAKASLTALRERNPTKKIVIVFGPHASSLSDRKSLEWYPGTFDQADEVIIPAVQVKKSTALHDRVYGKDIVEAIAKTQPNTHYMPLDDQIVKHLRAYSSDTLICFMSSGGWGDIINDTLG